MHAASPDPGTVVRLPPGQVAVLLLAVMLALFAQTPAAAEDRLLFPDAKARKLFFQEWLVICRANPENFSLFCPNVRDDQFMSDIETVTGFAGPDDQAAPAYRVAADDVDFYAGIVCRSLSQQCAKAAGGLIGRRNDQPFMDSRVLHCEQYIETACGPSRPPTDAEAEAAFAQVYSLLYRTPAPSRSTGCMRDSVAKCLYIASCKSRLYDMVPRPGLPTWSWVRNQVAGAVLRHLRRRFDQDPQIYETVRNVVASSCRRDMESAINGTCASESQSLMMVKPDCQS